MEAKQYENSLEFARSMDQADPLQSFKQQFHFPEHEGKPVIYFCGNSLGLQPKTVAASIEEELTTWREMAVGGYFGGKNPWLYYHEQLRPSLAKIMGAHEDEVTVMNALTVNLHLLMLSFYKPSAKRYKIMMESGAFPSDQYAIETLVRMHGLDPNDAIIEVAPKDGAKFLKTRDIIYEIEKAGDALAMVMFSGIQYYTGQLFDLSSITQAAHSVGAIAGFDLAHVAGNVPMQLHNWDVDFAAWCSYKYFNAGPGSVAGAFVHDKHAKNTNMNRLGGWWGNPESTRFKMEKGFEPKPTASGWNMSTTQVMNTAALKASLKIFDEAGIDRLRAKSISLTGYLEYLLHELKGLSFEIITPAEPRERGAQLSLYFPQQGKAIQEKMLSKGIVVDYREPGVIRVAPAPMYCSYEDVYRFYEILKNHF
jgi:kynureninase